MTFALLAAPLFLFGAPDVGPALAEEPSPAVVAAPAVTPRTASNVLFAEVLGNGLLYSVNYERIIDAWNIGLRAGVSYFTYAVSSYGKSGNLTIITFPLVASYFFGTPRHKVQLGLGGTILYTGVSSDSTGTKFESERSGAGISATGVVGYRYLPPDGGFTFGIGFTPLLRASSFLPWGGANAGYCF